MSDIRHYPYRVTPEMLEKGNGNPAETKAAPERQENPAALCEGLQGFSDVSGIKVR